MRINISEKVYEDKDISLSLDDNTWSIELDPIRVENYSYRITPEDNRKEFAETLEHIIVILQNIANLAKDK